MRNRQPLKQIADAVELAAAEFYKQFAPSKYKYLADEVTETALKAICQKHNTPYKAAKKVLLQDPIPHGNARSRS